MEQETHAIRLSALTNLGLGILGCGTAVIASSDAILIDGVFNLISMAAALVSMRVARLVNEPGDDSFPFGYAAFEPFLNVLKSALVLGVSVLAAISALEALRSGGRALNPTLGLGYGVVAAAACFTLAWLQARYARETQSPLVAVDAKNWLVNGAISSAVGIAFGIAFLLQGTSLAHWVPYVDPVLVLVLVLVTLHVPLRIALAAMAEILGAAPPREVRERLHAAWDGVDLPIEIRRTRFRMVRIGRFLHVLVYALTDPDQPVDRVADLDEIRERVLAALREAHPGVRLEVVFTSDARTIEGDPDAPGI